MKMTWLRLFACILAVAALLEPSLGAVCPEACICSNTRDGLHRATCSNLTELYKFSVRQKHHNINVLDLSHNNITKITYQLDRLTELVTLDLSTNRISTVNKLLPNAKKLVHLNLANNRIERLSLIHLPTSVSSLDLTNNLLQDVPYDLKHLGALEHLQLEGNPLTCSCDNIMARDNLHTAGVIIDNVKCASPKKLKGRPWLELKTKDICKVPKGEPDYLNMMMGDGAMDDLNTDKFALKYESLKTGGDLDDGSIIQGGHLADDDDNVQFMKVTQSTTESSFGILEGSGDGESTTLADIIEVKEPFVSFRNSLKEDEILPADNIPEKTLLEGSGEGSGFGTEDYEETEANIETTTMVYVELNPGPIHRLITEDDNSTTTEFPLPKPPTLYQGGPDWYNKTEAPIITAKPVSPLLATRDTTVSDKLEVTPSSDTVRTDDDKPTPHKTGTYVCIAIIVVLLVGLIGFAIIKGQMRKRRDSRILRQQKRDVEKASKEMVDMNKSLLGKPAGGDIPSDKKVNGKYELVPTHETPLKKSDNGDVGNGLAHNDNNSPRTDSPRDSNQNKSSSKDNNLSDSVQAPLQETSFESAPASPDSRKDTHSLSSVDIFVPMNDDETPRLNGTADSDLSQPLINGEPTDSDFLSPSREYVPVYSPDMGRVRIKMSETPKPKTPVLVTRSRSNAGDIIITPSMDANIRKSTT